MLYRQDVGRLVGFQIIIIDANRDPGFVFELVYYNAALYDAVIYVWLLVLKQNTL